MRAPVSGLVVWCRSLGLVCVTLCVLLLVCSPLVVFGQTCLAGQYLDSQAIPPRCADCVWRQSLSVDPQLFLITSPVGATSQQQCKYGCAGARGFTCDGYPTAIAGASFPTTSPWVCAQWCYEHVCNTWTHTGTTCIPQLGCPAGLVAAPSLSETTGIRSGQACADVPYCPPGQAPSALNGECQTCPPNTFSPGGSPPPRACIPCPAGSVSRANASQCVGTCTGSYGNWQYVGGYGEDFYSLFTPSPLVCAAACFNSPRCVAWDFRDVTNPLQDYRVGFPDNNCWLRDYYHEQTQQVGTEISFTTGLKPGQACAVADCAPGTGANAFSGVCEDCPANTFSPGGPVACTACPVGSWSAASASQCVGDCRGLAPGYFPDYVGAVAIPYVEFPTPSPWLCGQGCFLRSACTAWSYSGGICYPLSSPSLDGPHPAGTPVGSMDSGTVGFKPPACDRVPIPGQTYDPNGFTVDCPAGTWGPGPADGVYEPTPCNPCPAGMTSPPRSSSANACAPVPSCDGVANTDIPVFIRKHPSRQAAASPAACANWCRSGKSLPSSTPCVAWTFDPSLGSLPCTLILGASFSGVPLVFAAATGVTSGGKPDTQCRSVAACGVGRYDVDGATCADCPPGTYSSNTAALSSSTCTTCPVGYYSPTPAAGSSSTCLACAPGTTANAGSRQCYQCNYGAYYNPTRGCDWCVAGKYTAPTAGDPDWTYHMKTVCTDCVAGKYSAMVGLYHAGGCFDCTVGKFAYAGSTVCSECGAGTQMSGSSTTSAASCVVPPSCLGVADKELQGPSITATGGATTNVATAIDCANLCRAWTGAQACAGWTYASATKLCQLKTVGTQTDLLRQVTLVGSYSGGKPTNVCCAPGSANSSPDVCALCPANTWGAGGSAPCIACPAGTVSLAGSSACVPSCAGIVGIDHWGNDLYSFATLSPVACAQACFADISCRAWSHTAPVTPFPNGNCWIKSQGMATPNPAGTDWTAGLKPGQTCGVASCGVGSGITASGVCATCAAGWYGAGGLQSCLPTCAGLVGIDHWGNDLYSFATLSPVACAQACFADISCRAWSHTAPVTPFPNGNCWIKSQGMAIPNQVGTDRTAGLKPGHACVGPCAGVSGFDHYGHDLSGFGSASALSCAQSCFTTPKCGAWTYTGSTCYVKSQGMDEGGPIAAPSVKTGLRPAQACV